MDDDALLHEIAYAIERDIALGRLDDPATWQRMVAQAARAQALLAGELSNGELVSLDGGE